MSVLKSSSKEMAAQIKVLQERVDELEAEIQESRALARRLADVVDVVTELLVPAVDRDDAKLRDALARFDKVVRDPTA